MAGFSVTWLMLAAGGVALLCLLIAAVVAVVNLRPRRDG